MRTEVETTEQPNLPATGFSQLFSNSSTNRTLWMIGALGILVLIFAYVTDWAYITPRNVSNILRQAAINGILAVGIVFIIVTAEIDLSVGSLMGMLGGLAAIFDVWFGLPIYVTIALTIACGIVVGAFSGVWVAYMKVPSFIVTLAGMMIFRGALLGMTNGTTIAPISDDLKVLGQHYLSPLTGYLIVGITMVLYAANRILTEQRRASMGLSSTATTSLWTQIIGLSALLLGGAYLLNSYKGIPSPVIILFALTILLRIVGARTIFGRYVYAVGGSSEAARLSGINVESIKLRVFIISGTLAAIAGLVLTSRLGAGSPSAGNMAELDAIAACVIGGTSLAGGKGSVFGALGGALLIAALDNGMTMMNVDSFWQYIVKGTILLLAVYLDIRTNKTR